MASTGSQFTQGQRADSDTRSGSGDAAMLFGVHRLFNTGHLSLGITHDPCFSVLNNGNIGGLVGGSLLQHAGFRKYQCYHLSVSFMPDVNINII